MTSHLRSAALVLAFGIFNTLSLQSQAPVTHVAPSAPADPVPPPPTEHVVTLDVAVTTKNGKPVTGLEQHDFAVFDNGHPSPMLSFAAVAQPAAPPEVVIVVDTVNARYSSVAYERDEIKKLLQKMPDPLPPTSIAIITDTNSSLQAKPTTDRKQLLDNLANLDVQLRFLRRSSGFYGAAERFDISLRSLFGLVAQEDARPGRKLVFWVSPGWPLLSGPGVELTSKQEQAYFRTVVALSSQMRAARMTLYSVDPLGTADAGGFRTFYYESFLKPIERAQDTQIANLSLQVLATQSGGLVLTSSNDVTAELARCMQDAYNFYTLTIAPAAAEHPDEFHELGVKVEGSGLTVRTRNGYYAQP